MESGSLHLIFSQCVVKGKKADIRVFDCDGARFSNKKYHFSFFLLACFLKVISYSFSSKTQKNQTVNFCVDFFVNLLTKS